MPRLSPVVTPSRRGMPLSASPSLPSSGIESGKPSLLESPLADILYLATPYVAYPYGYDAAATMAAEAAARLVEAGAVVFSPIVHGHELALTGLLTAPPGDHSFWLEYDRPFMEVASALVVYQEQGWASSTGIAHETMQFRDAGKPVFYWPPFTDVPESILTFIGRK